VDVREFCTVLKIDTERCEYWITRQWVAPLGGNGGRRFREIDIARGQLLQDLERTMGVNEEGIDVIVHLIDQLYGIRMTMGELVAAIAAQPDEVRQRIVDEAHRSAAGGRGDRARRS